jgi:5-deoxy-glucuronate isomerase
MRTDLVRPTAGIETIKLGSDANPLRFLDFRVLTLSPGERHRLATGGRETTLVTISGEGLADVDGTSFPLSRKGVFDEMAAVLYLPPNVRTELRATTPWCVAVGSAPAVGTYPVRLVTPDEMRTELRGGGAALRQINHVLSHPLPAERMVLYEVYVPAGTWAGWPPHCHDGSHGSPYLEETYYFRFDRPGGFGFHRNYTDDGELDQVFTVRDGDCVVVPRGFHVTAASPAANMWILNTLAGEPVDDQRARPPYFDPTTTWITDDWDAGRLTLPIGSAP